MKGPQQVASEAPPQGQATEGEVGDMPRIIGDFERMRQAWPTRPWEASHLIANDGQLGMVKRRFVEKLYTRAWAKFR